MHEVSIVRLYVLRAMYSFIVVGLGIFLWPGILSSQRHWSLAEGESTCMLAAFSLLCLLGLRYPLQMLPLLFWELVWKMIWMIRVALPLWIDGKVDDALRMNSFAVGMGALLLAVIPWRYVAFRYLRSPGDPWRTRIAPRASKA